MEATSQLILRNEARLPRGALLLIDAPRDGLLRQLQSPERAVRVSTQDFGSFRWFRAVGAEAAYDAVPALAGDEQTIILHLPREKERLAMLLHALAAQMNPTPGVDAGAKLWLIGENRAGIKSAGRYLQQAFERVATLDKARHCALLEAAGPLPGLPFSVDNYARDWSVTHCGHEIRLRTLPGVFAHGRLDRGTALLLEALQGLRPSGRVLDFACGSGIVGLALLAAAERDLRPTLLDNSALAIESARRSLTASGLDEQAVTLLPSDGLCELGADARFDWIVSNPPFHRGVRNDLDVAAEFFRQAGSFLAEQGKMVVVFNRHLPYASWLQRVFQAVERLTESSEFTVMRVSRPVREGSVTPSGIRRGEGTRA
ncbi:MAG: methyltransferase [Lysobacterales bacterium]